MFPKNSTLKELFEWSPDFKGINRTWIELNIYRPVADFRSILQILWNTTTKNINKKQVDNFLLKGAGLCKEYENTTKLVLFIVLCIYILNWCYHICKKYKEIDRYNNELVNMNIKSFNELSRLRQQLRLYDNTEDIENELIHNLDVVEQSIQSLREHTLSWRKERKMDADKEQQLQDKVERLGRENTKILNEVEINNDILNKLKSVFNHKSTIYNDWNIPKLRQRLRDLGIPEKRRDMIRQTIIQAEQLTTFRLLFPQFVEDDEQLSSSEHKNGHEDVSESKYDDDPDWISQNEMS